MCQSDVFDDEFCKKSTKTPEKASLNTLKRRFVEKTVCSAILMQVPCQLFKIDKMHQIATKDILLCKIFTHCKYSALHYIYKCWNLTICAFADYITVMNSIINRKFTYTYSNATSILVIANVIVYFLTYMIAPRLMFTLSLIPSSIIYGHTYWQFVTYMFVHGGIWHLFSNMLGLFIFGSAVERAVGTREFILFYFLTGTLSGIASFFLFLFTGTNAVLMGASGALYALMLLFSVIYPRAVILVFGIIPVRAPVLVIIYFLIELFSGVGAYGGGVAHMTHLFGLVFAYLYCVIRMRINVWKAWTM